MSADVPRLRMFAGPNGSGKTTVKEDLKRPDSWFGIYINPDDLEKTIRQTGHLSLSPFGIETTTTEIKTHFSSSVFLKSKGLNLPTEGITYQGHLLEFSGLKFDSYCASVLADFLRQKALESLKSFTFETVMSSRDKIDLLKTAKTRGYRTYLYYIATEDPAINVERVRNRVAEGGHNVPEEKIRSRYKRSLELLADAIRCSDRAFFFDTSENSAWYFCEASSGAKLELKSDEMPNWFQPIWDQF